MKRFIAKDHIKEFNKLLSNNESISEKRLKKKLKEIGLPCSINFLIILKKYQIIKKNGEYYLLTSRIIHYTTLNNLYKDYEHKYK